MGFLKYLLLLFGLHLIVADYASYEEFIRNQAENATFVRLFEEHMKYFQDIDENGLKSGSSDTFHCKQFPRPSSKLPKTVHELGPQDIKVIGAMGDSITAGTGIEANTVIGLLNQYRGLSWSVGGDKTISEEETLANIVKQYNPTLTGYSTGWGPVWLESSSHLNVAEPGDVSENMPGQAIKIVDRIKNSKDINFEEDWKMITLFIGGNDLCKYCNDKEKYKAENYVAHIQTALDYLHDNVPRAYVNLVEVLDIAIVKTLNANLVCDALHLYLCSCAAYPANSEAEAEIKAETERYRVLMNDMVQTGRYDTRDDFTVVVQPFFRKTDPPKKADNGEPDLSYFAPDCFHLSRKGHRAAADALWNNLIEPVGKKRTAWTPGEIVECPSASSPYFYTYKNSDSSLSSSGLGSAPANAGVDSVAAPASGLDEKPNMPGTSQSGSIATVAILIGAIVGFVLVVLGAVAWRRSANKGRREHSLLMRRQYYSSI